MFRRAFAQASKKQNLFSRARHLATKAESTHTPPGGPESNIPPAPVSDIEPYARGVAWMHWLGAAGMVFLMGSALLAQQIPNDATATEEQKAKRWGIMFYHESVGMLMLGLLVPRLAIKLMSRAPKALPEPTWQHWAANASHLTLYGMLAFMPISGYLFGYLSGWGVPFFVEGWEFKGASEEDAKSAFNKKWEKFFYENHHRVGHWLTWYMFPLHIGAIGFTFVVRGINLFKRLPIP